MSLSIEESFECIKDFPDISCHSTSIALAPALGRHGGIQLERSKSSFVVVVDVVVVVAVVDILLLPSRDEDPPDYNCLQ